MAGNSKCGRKPIYSRPFELENKILEYEKECAEKHVFADEGGMMIYCKLTKRLKDQLCDEKNPNHEEYLDIFERAMYRRQSALERRMVTEPKSAIGCMNALKQKSNGGFTDKPQTENTQHSLTINIGGGQGMELFK